MSLFTWIQFALVCLLGAMSPGPSLVIIIRNSINYNRLAGIVTSVGHGVGIGVYATITVIGLGIIIKTSEKIFAIIQFSGSIFLIFLGFIFIFKKNNEDEINGYNINYSSFAQGFIVAVINPKILIFFLAIYSQFINSKAELFEKIILVSTASIIDALWYILVSIFVTSYSLKELLNKNKNIIQKLTGTLLIFIGISIIYKLLNY